MKILGIDPGNKESAFALIDNNKVIKFNKLENQEFIDVIFDILIDEYPIIAVEMIASYGMPVGKTVFDTCVFVGQILVKIAWAKEINLITRQTIKSEICHSVKAKDSNVRQSLIDIYGGENETKKIKCSVCKGKGWIGRNHELCSACKGKDSIKTGQLYGMSKDMWSALAVARATQQIIERKEKTIFYKF